MMTLFPTDLPELEWLEFPAQGFAAPACGLIFRTGRPPCCGVPLGGISTGCLDVEASGVFGYSSIFNPLRLDSQSKPVMPRTPPGYQPFLGLAVGGRTWVLAARAILEGGTVNVCTDPGFSGRQETCVLPKIEGACAAAEIHYWGHYPVVDMEYETDAPVGVALRAWAPFIPGDADASNVPGAVFEVHLRNRTDRAQQGALAFSFPGPTEAEAGAASFARRRAQGAFNGVVVTGRKASYALGVVGDERLRLGGDLGGSGRDWSAIETGLPDAAGGGSSAAVDFSLAPGEAKTVRFILAWYAPEWQGADENRYTHVYAARCRDALEVAERLAREHEALLGRICAWQEAVYTAADLPVWLRDCLVNNLCLIAETSYWALPQPPLGDWCAPDGFFGLLESPRGCPQIECIPCSWYGNLPIVYFFPELARSTLRGYQHYMREDGAAPFLIGRGGPPDMATPSWDWQISLNGPCYVDLVDRLWLRTSDDGVLREFYDSVQRNVAFTMNLRPGPEGVISMPAGNVGMEWFEQGEWLGMCSHLGGLRLSTLRIAQRMAERVGDEEFARRCREWFEQGSRAMEELMWAGSYYLNFYDLESGKRSDDVMGYQMDGEWAARFHGVRGVFQQDRVEMALETIKRCNVPLAICGAVSFARPDGSALTPDAKVAEYGPHAMFPPEVLILAMNYLYDGDREFGLELARRSLDNIVRRQRHPWDQPNMVRGDTGERIFGTDYYQNMMLWALPAALAGEGLRAPLEPGGLVDRVLRAAQMPQP